MTLVAAPARLSTTAATFEADFAARLHWSADTDAAIKALGVFQYRCIAALVHVGQDIGHALLDGRVGVGRPMQAGCKISLKSGRSG